ncbi:MAG TPA: winged helix DNA-binding domain-containing protein [Anaerolineales bacterium]|nr:winged helix DNA-binding domain-containing protein [Anaerolineales bacterium]
MAGLTATFDQVNHYLWHRQGFQQALESAPINLFGDVFGIYATAPTCYLTLLARHRDFRFTDLLRAVEDERQAVRMRGMRYSNFLIPVRLLPALFQAVKRDPENPIIQMRKLGITDADYENTAEVVHQIVDGQTMTASEIRKALPVEVVERFGGALSYLYPQMCADGRLVRAKVRGGWKSDLYEYAVWDQWLPGVDLNSISREGGQVILAQEYFNSYGPATPADLQWWSGFSKADTSRAIAVLGDELTRIDVDGTEHMILASRVDDLLTTLASTDQPKEVRLLPVWDAYLMAYRDRTRYLPDERYGYIYDRGGNSTFVLLIDGKLGGVWDMAEDKKTLVIKAVMFDRSDNSAWQQLRDEGMRLAKSAGYSSTRVLRCESAPILREGSQNLFLSPLKDVPGETTFESTI